MIVCANVFVVFTKPNRFDIIYKNGGEATVSNIMLIGRLAAAGRFRLTGFRLEKQMSKDVVSLSMSRKELKILHDALEDAINYQIGP